MTNKILFTLLALCFLVNLYGQGDDSTRAFSKSIGIGLYKENITFPFEKKFTTINHYGFHAQYSFGRKPKKFSFKHSFQLSYFEHKAFFKAGILSYKPAFQYRLINAIILSVPIGLGYGMSTSTEQGYVLKEGEYVKSPSKFKSHIAPSIGLGIGCDLSAFSSIPLEFHLYYEYLSLLPYSDNGSLPFTLHANLGISINYKL